MGLLDWFRRGRRRTLEEELEHALQHPSPELLDSLLAAVMEKADQGRMHAMFVVEQLSGGGKGARDMLAALIVDTRWPMVSRNHALRSLARAQHEVVLQLAEQRADDDDPCTRSVIAEALGSLDDPAVVPYLERLLVDDTECVDMWCYWRVMDEAARSLARWRECSPAYDAWVDARILELEGESKGAAAISLGFVRHQAAIAPLIDEAMGGHCWELDLLEMYRSREVADALCAALSGAGESSRFAIAQALGKNGDPSCIPVLSQILAEGEGSERSAAARGLRWLEHDDARRILADYSDDPDADVREQVRWTFEPPEAT